MSASEGSLDEAALLGRYQPCEQLPGLEELQLPGLYNTDGTATAMGFRTVSALRTAAAGAEVHIRLDLREAETFAR
ncbi:hypothetical protein GPECTOR_5000g1301 [Gonium pectorale]|uniref:Uncharacterized protein n=1 Tax=Gonium pectorale TaxID=33097 RepID=A0A150H4V9_GONPE|nr:hypothetical protein GPECTOR_5000g1301 [Gonium pectorale]|eukprot:KXZ57074.1 hypothetical protein GPECTOR_5000g1301 [Gonium pectorale]